MTKVWNKDECIEAFHELSEACPEKIITRDFFRKNSDCPESKWSQYFGTFSEFKIQAGYDLTTHQEKHLTNISKHSSKDKFREFNKEKSQYADKYLRPNSKRYQTVMICSDTHDIHCDDFYLRTFIDTIKRVQPETVILGGDIVDNVDFSKHWTDPRDYKLVDRIKWLHKFLHNIREAVPTAEIDYIAGNHDAYLLKHLCEASPQLMTLLSDIHGHTISSLLGIDEYQVNFVSKEDLTVFTDAQFKNEVKKNDIVKYNCLYVNHYSIKNPVMTSVNGHNHKLIMKPYYNHFYGNYHTIQLGTGHVRNATYCDARQWDQGWLIAHIDTQKLRVQPEYINTTHDFTMIGGKLYERTIEELFIE